MVTRHAATRRLRDLLHTVTRRVLLAASARDHIEAICRQEHHGLETGGILLGHEHADGHLSVTTAGGPGPRAERTPTSFHRDAEHARALARDAHARDASVWVGEWHTHPTGPSHPSPTDLRTYFDIVRDPAETFDAFVALIVLPDNVRLLFFAWVVTAQAAELSPLWVRQPD